MGEVLLRALLQDESVFNAFFGAFVSDLAAAGVKSGGGRVANGHDRSFHALLRVLRDFHPKAQRLGSLHRRVGHLGFETTGHLRFEVKRHVQVWRFGVGRPFHARVEAFGVCVANARRQRRRAPKFPPRRCFEDC